MLQHNLTLAFRSFNRYRSTFFINLIGLSAGLACALLIYLWVKDEVSFDKFHEKDGQLFQVMKNAADPAGVQTGEDTRGILAEALAAEMPEVEYAVATVHPWGRKGFVLVGDTRLEAVELYAGRDFFSVFSFNLVEGNKDQVLAGKNAVAISQELATKLFGTTRNIVGKSVEWNRKDFNEWNPKDFNGSYLITGVFEKPPANSSLQFDLLFNYELYLDKYPDVRKWSHNSNNPNTYVTLKEGADPVQLGAKLTNFIKTKHAESTATLFIRKYSDQYLYGRYENGVNAGGRIEYVKLFSVIAFFILVIACINFMNLSTAKATSRIKEVGIKKAIGGDRMSLIVQFLGESLLLTFLSFVIALLLVLLLLPQFNVITGKDLALSFNVNLILSLLGITLFTGLVAGSYPAIYLSGFNPALILKGSFNNSAGEVWVRKVLVVFQFTLSIVLIVSVVVIYRQIQLVHTKNLGYNRSNVVFFQRSGKVPSDPERDMETFLREVKNIPGVMNAANLGYDMTGSNGTTGDIVWTGKNPEDKTQFHILHVGYDLIETLGYQMVAGRTYVRGSETKNKIIFNQAAVEIMGLTNPVGERIKWGETEYEIIGVVKDFNFESLYEKVKPCFFNLLPKYQNVAVKINAGRERETIEGLQHFYRGYVGLPLVDYRFLDEDYQAMYATENRIAVLSKYFAGIAILISCLGLFGLAAFTAERRRKEIAIRKVLGSNQAGIVYLLSGHFTKMVLIAIFIALPLSYVLADQWLDNFAYSIKLKWWYFALAGIVSLLISWLTIGAQVMKAAKVSPVKSLKD